MLSSPPASIIACFRKPLYLELFDAKCTKSLGRFATRTCTGSPSMAFKWCRSKSSFSSDSAALTCRLKVVLFTGSDLFNLFSNFSNAVSDTPTSKRSRRESRSSRGRFDIAKRNGWNDLHAWIAILSKWTKQQNLSHIPNSRNWNSTCKNGSKQDTCKNCSNEKSSKIRSNTKLQKHAKHANGYALSFLFGPPLQTSLVLRHCCFQSGKIVQQSR